MTAKFLNSDRARRDGMAAARAAFSLVELLVVVALMVLLVGLLVPSLSSVQGASQLRRAGEMVSEAVSLARQTALARNRSVVFRFYSRDENDPYFACQYFLVDDDGSLTPGRLYRLPEAMVVSRNTQHTSLPAVAGTATATLPGNQNVVYSEFRFRRDGSTDLDASGHWFFTLVHQRDAATARPNNFQSLLIDPGNGTVRTFQP